MRAILVGTLLTTSFLFSVSGASFSADSKRGGAIFANQGCTNCHSVSGQGGKTAPDLGRRLDRNYTPAGIASLMWNHAPAMWSAISKQGMAMPKLTETDAADLLAFFYAARFFERPGEAQRGKALFASRHCADCHALAAGASSVGPPVPQWKGLADPTVLVTQMFDHAAQMNKAMRDRNISWPQLSAQDLTDLLVYLQNLPQTRGTTLEFEIPSDQGGEELFRSKGCAACHSDARAFENLISDSTLTDVAAAMWNHAPLMVRSAETAPPAISVPEMRQILSYIWARQFFSPRGDAARGKRLFESKKCETCHANPSSGAPALTGATGTYSAAKMIEVLWEHGPAMLDKMRQQNIAWPHLSPVDMTSLIAYLNSR